MSQAPLKEPDGPEAHKRRSPPRILFVLAYPAAILVLLVIMSFREGDINLIAGWSIVAGLIYFPLGLGALFVWDVETLSEFEYLMFGGGYAVWIWVVGSGVIRPTYRKLALVGIVAVANIGGCNLKHVYPQFSP